MRVFCQLSVLWNEDVFNGILFTAIECEKSSLYLGVIILWIHLNSKIVVALMLSNVAVKWGLCKQFWAKWGLGMLMEKEKATFYQENV